MIRLKENPKDDYRLYDTKSGKFVPFTAENRSRALFCLLVDCESKKENKNPGYRYSVEELADIYYKQLVETVPEKLTAMLCDKFVYKLHREIGIVDLIDDENFNKLVLCVLSDQKSEQKRITEKNIEALKKDYGYMDEKIFDMPLEKLR